MPETSIETTTNLRPKFGADGLITAVVTHVDSGELLMVAHMNRDALDKSVALGTAHFWSRSRQRLWQKGESSGHFLHITDIRIDCDQDAVWLIARPDGPTCHTGTQSCFYRRITADGALVPVAGVGG
ncbi:MAG: phosphoribosyl-AMP cyclohydrolase [Sphingopyxis sp.]